MLVTPAPRAAASEGAPGVDSGIDSGSGDEDEDEGEMDDEARTFWEQQERAKEEAARQQAIRDANESEA